MDKQNESGRIWMTLSGERITLGECALLCLSTLFFFAGIVMVLLLVVEPVPVGVGLAGVGCFLVAMLLLVFMVALAKRRLSRRD